MTINVNLIKRYLVYRKAGELFPGIFKSIIDWVSKLFVESPNLLVGWFGGNI